MYRHLSEKRQKAVFLGPDKFQNHANEGKGNAERKERGGRKEEKRKKQWLQSQCLTWLTVGWKRSI